jgi:alpha-tubulin suppressor-like RCC1 family protein
VAVNGGLTFTSIATGGSHTCALTSAGAIYCWGRNTYGQIGDGSTTERHVPVLVSGGNTFTSIFTGEQHSCGLNSSGTLYCWGWNLFGQLGDNTTTDRHAPVTVSGSLIFSSILNGSAGYQTCALSTSGAAFCWGHNQFGQIGNNSTTNSNVPAAVSGGRTFSSISAGGWNHVCGLTSTGTAYCWGRNSYGELGNNSTANQHVPSLIPNL